MASLNELEASPTRWITDAVFSEADAYDLAFAWNVSPELDAVLALAKPAPGARLLLPACGTGRYAVALAERGFDVDASDINDGMLTLARSRPHARVRYALADMTKPFGEGVAAAAFTFTNSFRYILGDSDVHGHLRAVYDRLAPGATYVVNLGFTDRDAPCGQGARWTVRYADQVVRASWTLMSSSPPLSMERARITVEEADGTVREVVADQPQRIWSFGELRETAARAGFVVRGAFLPDATPAADPSVTGRYYVALDRP